MPKPAQGGRPTALRVEVTPEERARLEGLLRSQTCSYGLHKRARAVLLAADGLMITEIARRVDLQRRHVYRWLRQFQASGLDGLLDKPRHGPVLGRWAPRRRESDDAC